MLVLLLSLTAERKFVGCIQSFHLAFVELLFCVHSSHMLFAFQHPFFSHSLSILHAFIVWFSSVLQAFTACTQSVQHPFCITKMGTDFL